MFRPFHEVILSHSHQKCHPNLMNSYLSLYGFYNNLILPMIKIKYNIIINVLIISFIPPSLISLIRTVARLYLSCLLTVGGGVTPEAYILLSRLIGSSNKLTCLSLGLALYKSLINLSIALLYLFHSMRNVIMFCKIIVWMSVMSRSRDS